MTPKSKALSDWPLMDTCDHPVAFDVWEGRLRCCAACWQEAGWLERLAHHEGWVTLEFDFMGGWISDRKIDKIERSRGRLSDQSYGWLHAVMGRLAEKGYVDRQTRFLFMTGWKITPSGVKAIERWLSFPVVPG